MRYPGLEVGCAVAREQSDIVKRKHIRSRPENGARSGRNSRSIAELGAESIPVVI